MLDHNDRSAFILEPVVESSLATETFNIEERLFTAQEVADRLRVSERWVRDHATQKPAHSLLSLVRYCDSGDQTCKHLWLRSLSQ